ncbi:MAG: UbiD family decarboxylase [Chlamydia sp.]
MHYRSPPKSLREYISRLQEQNEIIFISAHVDPYLEIAEITRRVVGASGPALFFTNVKNSHFPVVTNLYGSQKRLKIAFGEDIPDRIETFISLFIEQFPPSFSSLWKHRSDIITLIRSLRIEKKRALFSTPPSLAVEQQRVSLEELPLLTSWKEDGGAFITLPLVYTESPKNPKRSKNLGMYRVQRFNSNRTGLHWQIGKGGGFHFQEAEELNVNLPVSIFIGGPPALTLAAITPLPENVPELLFASFLLKEPLKVTNRARHPHRVPWEADFTLQGFAEAHARRIEGPFGDHFGYLSLAHEFPTFHCQQVFHKKDAIFPATVVGPPPQEDLYIGEFLQNALKPLFPIVMPSIRSIHTYSESGFHALAALQMKERYEKEALTSALRLLGEGQLALTKIVCAIDAHQEIDLADFRAVFQYLLERIRGEEDIIILSHTANDTLDYTGPSLNRGSKAIFLGTGKDPRRVLPKIVPSLTSYEIEEMQLFCPGCIVISIHKDVDLQLIAQMKSLQEFPCVVIVDNVSYAVSSQIAFLWTVFTRFEPASDILFPSSRISRNMAEYTLPMVIDARMKASYPPILTVDPATEQLVSSRWKEYFPT